MQLSDLNAAEQGFIPGNPYGSSRDSWAQNLSTTGCVPKLKLKQQPLPQKSLKNSMGWEGDSI